MSLRSTIKPRTGKTPNRPANKTDSSSSSPTLRSRFDVNSLNFKEKLELLDKHEGTEDESDLLISLICCDDLHEDYIEEPKRRTKPYDSSGIAKNLQSKFELESDSYTVYAEKDGDQGGVGGVIVNNEDDFVRKDIEVPEVIQQVLKGIKALDECSKAFTEIQEAEIETEKKKGTSKLVEMINTIEAKVMPALQKVLKDPARFNEMARREPPQKGIPCNFEDQKKLIESLTSISEVCFQLRNLKFSSNEIEGKCDTLEQLANYVDSNLDGQGAEKLKLKNLEKFLHETVSSYKKDEE